MRKTGGEVGAGLGAGDGVRWEAGIFIGMVGDLEGDWISIGAEGVEWDGMGM